MKMEERASCKHLRAFLALVYRNYAYIHICICMYIYAFADVWPCGIETLLDMRVYRHRTRKHVQHIFLFFFLCACALAGNKKDTCGVSSFVSVCFCPPFCFFNSLLNEREECLHRGLGRISCTLLWCMYTPSSPFSLAYWLAL